MPDQGSCEIDTTGESVSSVEDGSSDITWLLVPDTVVVALRVYSKPGLLNRTADEVALSVPLGGSDGSSEQA